MIGTLSEDRFVGTSSTTAEIKPDKSEHIQPNMTQFDVMTLSLYDLRRSCKLKEE
jgi:hypothetical protein